MATSLQVGDILSARAWCTDDGQASVNTYNYSVIAVTGGAVTDQNFCDAFDSLVDGYYGNSMTTHTVYNGIQVYFLKRASGPLPNPVKTTIAAGPGTAVGFPTPPNSAPLLKYTSTTRGPGGRGRLYMPFVAAGFLSTNGQTSTAYDVLLNSLASALLTPLVVTAGVSSATLVWSLVRRPAHLPPTVTGQIITAESSGKFGQMHKRGFYGRPNVSPI